MSVLDVPISLPFNVAKMPRKGQVIKFEAQADQFAAIAEFLDVDGVLSFAAHLQLSAWRKGGIKLDGSVQAKMQQTCSITLETMETEINHQFEQWFVHHGSRLAQPQLNEEGEIIIDLENPDLPDTYENDMIDFGSVILEQAVLAVDPYPRIEGAEFEAPAVDESLDDKPPSPFAVLAQLKDQTSKK